MTSAVRTPAVAGRFYPGRAEELLRDIRKYTSARNFNSDWPHRRHRMRRSPCGICLLRRGCRSGVFAPRNSRTLHSSLPQSHGQGASAGGHGQYYVANSAGRSGGGRGVRLALAAPLPCSRRGQRRAQSRTRHRSPTAFSASATAAIEDRPHRRRHQRL